MIPCDVHNEKFTVGQYPSRRMRTFSAILKKCRNHFVILARFFGTHGYIQGNPSGRYPSGWATTFVIFNVLRRGSTSLA